MRRSVLALLLLGCSSDGTTPMPATGCHTQADCDDQMACTTDRCLVGGVCEHAVDNAMCTAPQVCVEGRGCVVPGARACSATADCDDGRRCNGPETCSALACSAGTSVSCDDADPCTVDTCNDTGAEMCSHMMNPRCMAKVRSGTYDLVTPVRYACTADGMPAVTLDIQSFQFAVSTSSLTVTPGPTGTAMTSPPPSLANFDVTGTVAGTCTEHYSLTGMFTDATHFTGSYTARFVDAFPGACAQSTCTAQTFTVMGVARM